jgi:uncharacterized delta-60 repeat protein
MTLITRQEKGLRLTIPELDNNLEYLETLGIKEITQEDNKVILERPDNSISEITIDNNLPVVLKNTFGDEETGFITYKGTLKYDFESSTNIIPLKYNIDKDTLLDIDSEWGKTYYFSGRVLRCIGNDCSDSLVYGYLESNINYDPNKTFDIYLEDISVIEFQSDGKILVGGYLYKLGRTDFSNKYILRLNSFDGSIDNTFNIGSSFNAQTLAIKQQSDGKILVGGKFTSYNDITSNYIIRLNSNGSIDDTFNIGTGFNVNNNYNHGVFSIQIQSDGKILVGGSFTSYNGTTRNRIIRLNSDGSIDNTFNIGTGFNNRVSEIKIQSDGKILVGGWFTSYNGTTSNRIIRLNSDGSIDNTFNIGTGFNDNVRVIEIQSDGKILVGGQFISYNETSYNKLIRLNSNGSIDTTFNIGSGFSTQSYNTVRALKIQSDGKILVGGGFEVFNGDETKKYFIRLNSNGSIDTTLNIASGEGPTNYIQAIQIQSDGKILVGGWRGFFRFFPDGTSDVALPKFNTPLGSLISSDDKLHITINESDNMVLQYEIIQRNFKK